MSDSQRSGAIRAIAAALCFAEPKAYIGTLGRARDAAAEALDALIQIGALSADYAETTNGGRPNRAAANEPELPYSAGPNTDDSKSSESE